MTSTASAVQIRPENHPDRDDLSRGFDQFWAAYPRKQNKRMTLSYWKRRKAFDNFDTIMEALEKHKRCDQWAKNGGIFIPLPSTWIRDERWEDVVKITKPIPAGECSIARDENAAEGALESLAGIGIPRRAEAELNCEERGYRRGYWHGYSQAMDDLLSAGLKRGKEWNEVARFFDTKLTEWWAGDVGNVVEPPMLRAHQEGSGR